jgi:hypothetical protein
MALLTAEEKAKLAQEGLWVKEKCDICDKPILSPVSYIKKIQGKEKVVCAGCAKGKDLVLTNTKEENEMAKVKAEKKAAPKKESTKVGGVLIAGTAIADLYELLSDEKKHPISACEKIVAKHKKELTDRLGNLRRVGAKKKMWGLIVDEDGKTIQMKMGAAAAAASPKTKPKAKEAPAKKATSKKEQEPDETAAMPSKALKATMALIRRTLKSGSDWTKNKMMEHLMQEHDQDPKRVAAAMQEEIKAGGIKVEEGYLQLV